MKGQASGRQHHSPSCPPCLSAQCPLADLTGCMPSHSTCGTGVSGAWAHDSEAQPALQQGRPGTGETQCYRACNPALDLLHTSPSAWQHALHTHDAAPGRGVHHRQLEHTERPTQLVCVCARNPVRPAATCAPSTGLGPALQHQRVRHLVRETTCRCRPVCGGTCHSHVGRAATKWGYGRGLGQRAALLSVVHVSHTKPEGRTLTTPHHTRPTVHAVTRGRGRVRPKGPTSSPMCPCLAQRRHHKSPAPAWRTAQAGDTLHNPHMCGRDSAVRSNTGQHKATRVDPQLLSPHRPGTPSPAQSVAHPPPPLICQQFS